MKDKPGVTGEVLDIVKKHGFTLDSVLTTYEGTKKGYKRVVVRTIGKEGNVEKAQGELNNLFGGPFM
jgi:acetolactate synthase small subunit